MEPNSEIRLRPLTPADESEALAAHAELQADDFGFLLDHAPAEPWPDYINKLAEQRRALNLFAGRVPATFLVATVGEHLVGRTSIRHELNDYLFEVGGHIGYAVRPAFRRRGYATEILRQSLVIARSEGVDRVLVTCDDGNAGSAVVIERCGGRIEDVRLDPDGVRKRRYWID